MQASRPRSSFQSRYNPYRRESFPKPGAPRVKLVDRPMSTYFEGDVSSMQIDFEGRYSLTQPAEARQMVDIIRKAAPTAKSVLDATAGWAGNTIYFATKFEKVTAVEKDPKTFAMLTNNVKHSKVEGFDAERVTLLNLDCMAVLNQEKADVIFMDPPWNREGEEWHKNRANVPLYLSNVGMPDIVRKIFVSTAAKIVALKVPRNFDFDELREDLFLYRVRRYDLANYSFLTIQDFINRD